MTKKPMATKTKRSKKATISAASDANESSALSSASDKDVKVIFVRLNVEGWRELRKLAAEEDTSVQALMIESINRLLTKRGRPASAANPLLK